MFYQILREVIYNSEELYEFYGQSLNSNGVLFSAVIAISVQAILFLLYISLRGTALYKMSDKLGEKRLWLAFLPCGCFYLLGRLQDDSMPSSKRNSLYTWIAVIASAIYVIFGILLEVFGAVPTVKALLGATEKEVITKEYMVSTPLTSVLSIVMSIAGLVYSIAAIILYMNVFRAYVPTKATKYTIISVIADILFGTSIIYGIFLFRIRNNERVGYAGYARARANFYGGGYSRYNGGNYYGGNGYGGGNYYGGNGGNSYDGNNAYGDNNGNKKTEEPFEEFSSDEAPKDNGGEDFFKDKPDDRNYGRNSDDGDDLFS